MTTVSASISINQPVEKVFEYMINVQNHKDWQTGLLEASVTPDGPVAVGSTYSYTTEVMGQKMQTQLEVTAIEQNKLWSVKTINVPMSVEMTYSFEAEGNGTKMTISSELSGGYPAAAEAMVKESTKKNFEDQCQKIKSLLE